MNIIPAIDLLNKECVRLYKGDYSKSTSYEKDPVKVALAFEKAGARRIHVVDLDAAKGQGINNRDVIKKICESVSCSIEVGGGIRSDNDIDELIKVGVNRLILGTILVKNPELPEKWIKKYGNIFIAGIDSLNGDVKVSGWEKASGIIDTDLVKKAAAMGFISVIYTNISKDGTLEGPDVERTVLMAKESGLPVILSGGISSSEDIKTVCDLDNSGIVGIITGKAIYEEKINITEVINKYQKDIEGLIW